MWLTEIKIRSYSDISDPVNVALHDWRTLQNRSVAALIWIAPRVILRPFVNTIFFASCKPYTNPSRKPLLKFEWVAGVMAAV